MEMILGMWHTTTYDVRMYVYHSGVSLIKRCMQREIEKQNQFDSKQYKQFLGLFCASFFSFFLNLIWIRYFSPRKNFNRKKVSRFLQIYKKRAECLRRTLPFLLLTRRNSAKKSENRISQFSTKTFHVNSFDTANSQLCYKYDFLSGSWSNSFQINRIWNILTREKCTCEFVIWLIRECGFSLIIYRNHKIMYDEFCA